MVQSDVTNIDEQDENVELLASPHGEGSSEQRLEKALNYIETFLVEQNNQLKLQSDFKNKEVVLANLDILISHMQDILQQFDTTES